MTKKFNESLQELEMMLMEPPIPMAKRMKVIHNATETDQKAFQDVSASTETTSPQIQWWEKAPVERWQSIISKSLLTVLYCMVIYFSIKNNYLFFGELLAIGVVSTLLLMLQSYSPSDPSSANLNGSAQ